MAGARWWSYPGPLEPPPPNALRCAGLRSCWRACPSGRACLAGHGRVACPPGGGRRGTSLCPQKRSDVLCHVPNVTVPRGPVLSHNNQRFSDSVMGPFRRHTMDPECIGMGLVGVDHCPKGHDPPPHPRLHPPPPRVECCGMAVQGQAPPGAPTSITPPPPEVQRSAACALLGKGEHRHLYPTARGGGKWGWGRGTGTGTGGG